MRLLLDVFASPIGDLLLIHDDEEKLRALDFHDFEPRMLRLLRLHYGTVELTRAPAPAATTSRLAAYFAGDFDALDGISVATRGTEFQRRVWAALRRIPTGSTLSYGVLAKTIGSDKAMRAVGLANGANPIAIVIPCHRVIGSTGALTGFGGGLHRKRWLLGHEGVALKPERSASAKERSAELIL